MKRIIKVDNYENKVFEIYDVAGVDAAILAAAVAPASGDTASRPASPGLGMQYFDTDEGKVIAFNGTDWVNVDGTSLV